MAFRRRRDTGAEVGRSPLRAARAHVTFDAAARVRRSRCRAAACGQASPIRNCGQSYFANYLITKECAQI
jgi:hypothetical protein